MPRKPRAAAKPRLSSRELASHSPRTDKSKNIEQQYSTRQLGEQSVPRLAATGPLPELPAVYQIDSGTASLQIDQDRGVTLYVNDAPSSFINIPDPRFLVFEYMQQMDQIVGNLKPGAIKALHLGAGACALAWAWSIERPGSRQLAVDIDAQLVSLARQWFDLPRAPALRIRAQDAWETISQTHPNTYDVIVRDVFSGDQTPENLTTTAFDTAIHAGLKTDGIYLANCADKPPLTKARKELGNLIEIFGKSQVGLCSERTILTGKRYGNVVLVARKTSPDNDDTQNVKPLSLDNPTLARALRSLPVPAAILAGAGLDSFIQGRRLVM